MPEIDQALNLKARRRYREGLCAFSDTNQVNQAIFDVSLSACTVRNW